MTQASVGFHCPECTRQGANKVVTARTGAFAGDQPIVTQVLIALNAFAFVATLVTGGGLWGSGESNITEQGVLIGAWPPNRAPVQGVAAGEWWRVFTGGFLHQGILHLAMNMFVLWIIGAQIERAIGKSRYLALYVTCLVAGAFAVLLVDPLQPTLGASGAIFGLLGAAVALQRSRGINPWQSGIAGLIVLNLVITFTIPGISVAGHVGGLVGGLVAGYVMFEFEKRSVSTAVAVGTCLALGGALFVGCLWAAGRLVPVV